jgi:hypothetical protein
MQKSLSCAHTLEFLPGALMVSLCGLHEPLENRFGVAVAIFVLSNQRFKPIKLSKTAAARVYSRTTRP